jgi:hypothetical protein
LITDARKKCGLEVINFWNKKEEKRVFPCPNDKLEEIKDAFNHFRLLK